MGSGADIELVAGKVIDTTKPEEQAKLRAWMLTEHVRLCRKGGIDCRTCVEAAAQGIKRET